MTKIVYNASYGGFNLSHAAVMLYCQLKGIAVYPETTEWGAIIYWLAPFVPDDKNAGIAELNIEEIERSDPALVEAVERLEEAANIHGNNLQIQELPKGTRYRIREYDGLENIVTFDEQQWKVA